MVISWQTEISLEVHVIPYSSKKERKREWDRKRMGQRYRFCLLVYACICVCVRVCVCVCGGGWGGGLGWVGGRGSGKMCKFLSFDCAMDTCNVVCKLCIHHSLTMHLRPALIHRPLSDLSCCFNVMSFQLPCHLQQAYLLEDENSFWFSQYDIDVTAIWLSESLMQ